MFKVNVKRTGARPVTPNHRNLGRNDICPCPENVGRFDPATGKPTGGRAKPMKYKHCCMGKPLRLPAGYAVRGVDHGPGPSREVERSRSPKPGVRQVRVYVLDGTGRLESGGNAGDQVPDVSGLRVLTSEGQEAPAEVRIVDESNPLPAG